MSALVLHTLHQQWDTSFKLGTTSSRIPRLQERSFHMGVGHWSQCTAWACIWWQAWVGSGSDFLITSLSSRMKFDFNSSHDVDLLTPDGTSGNSSGDQWLNLLKGRNIPHLPPFQHAAWSWASRPSAKDPGPLPSIHRLAGKGGGGPISKIATEEMKPLIYNMHSVCNENIWIVCHTEIGKIVSLQCFQLMVSLLGTDSRHPI